MQVTYEDLMSAADRFAERTDSFAAGKAGICRDMAKALQRFGDFASEKQAEFAAKLVTWSQPRQAAEEILLPRIESMVRAQNMTLHLGECKVVYFKSGAVGVVSPAFGVATYGVIEDGRFKRFGKCTDEMVALLKDVEARGIDAVKEIGRATGRCCVCSRMLTNDTSIEAGIGPICAGKVTF